MDADDLRGVGSRAVDVRRHDESGSERIVNLNGTVVGAPSLRLDPSEVDPHREVWPRWSLDVATALCPESIGHDVKERFEGQHGGNVVIREDTHGDASRRGA